jgi:hypothetical protein
MFMNSVDVSNNNDIATYIKIIYHCVENVVVTYLPKVPYKPVAVVVLGVFLQIMLM